MAKFPFPTPPREDEVPEGEILAGKYRVERVLGAGGMGVVVRVTPVEGQGVFALKFLRPSVGRDPLAAPAPTWSRSPRSASSTRARRTW